MRAMTFGAVALVLIISCPLILGYAMASDEVEYTKITESDTTAITENLLNAESDYFINYSKSNNNSMMLQRVTSQGDHYYLYTAPDYVSVSDVYSSIPAYDVTSQHTTITSTTTSGSDSIPDATIYATGAVIGSVAALQSDWNEGYTTTRLDVTYTPDTYTFYQMTSSYNVYVLVDGVADTTAPDNFNPPARGGIQSDTLVAIPTGTNEWTYIINGTEYVGSWAMIVTQHTATISYTARDYVEVPPLYITESEDWSMVFPVNPGAVRLDYTDSASVYYTADSISHSVSYCMIDNAVVDYPDAVYVATAGGVLYYYTSVADGYADPARGWYNAESSQSIYYNAWYNQYENATITMYVSFEGNGETLFYEDFGMAQPIVEIKRTNNVITLTDSDATAKPLGSYKYARVDFNVIDDTVTVSGIASIPSMGATPQTLNSMTLDYDYDDYITHLVIVDQFSTITPAVADYSVENGDTVTVSFSYPRPENLFYLYDSNGDAVTSGWSATVAGDYASATFSPTDLETGLYTFTKVAPQGGSESFTIYVGNNTPVSTSPISYRVDATSIVAGDYPSTIDYTLDIYSLFPNDSTQIIYLNSIGVYGDLLTIAGIDYTISTNNTIAITDIDSGDSVAVKLLKSTIKIVNEGGTYSTYINGYHIADTSSAPTVYFGGEWSLTATRGTVTEESAVRSEWVAGEFAFDTGDFVLAMGITAVAAFVILGMTGARSGAKVAVLALICGGACAVGFMMI